MVGRRQDGALGRAVLEAALRAQAGDLRAVSRVLGRALSTIYRAIDKHGLRRLAGLPFDGSEVSTERPRNAEGIKKDRTGFASNRKARPRLPEMTSDNDERPPEPDERLGTSITVNKALWRQAKKLAIDKGCSVSQVVELALRDLLRSDLEKEER